LCDKVRKKFMASTSRSPYGFGVDVLCPYVRRPAYGGHSDREVDEIRVAGAIDIPGLLCQMKSLPDKGRFFVWTLAVIASLDPAAVRFPKVDTRVTAYGPSPNSGWCGADLFRLHKASSQSRTSHQALATVAGDLAKWNVFKEVDPAREHMASSISARLFTVEKGEKHLRVILDCRNVNSLVGEPPELKLATLPKIAEVFRYFPGGW
jgi:hypothetical protein